MLVAVPHIEFVKGILTALEPEDFYFDVNKRNLIVFDDQMIDPNKDKRIVNLLILLVLIIAQGHPTTIFGKYLFGRRFEI